MQSIKTGSDNKTSVYTRINNAISYDRYDYTLKNIIDVLESTNGRYFFKVDTKKSYTFYGRCCEFNGNFNKFRKSLLSFLKSEYNIDMVDGDVSFAKTITGCYMYCIPGIYGSCSLLKKIHEAFDSLHGESLGDCLDLSMYEDGNMIEYPSYERNLKSNLKVVVGEINDFVIDFVKDGAVLLDKIHPVGGKNKVFCDDDVKSLEKHDDAHHKDTGKSVEKHKDEEHSDDEKHKYDDAPRKDIRKSEKHKDKEYSDDRKRKHDDAFSLDKYFRLTNEERWNNDEYWKTMGSVAKSYDKKDGFSLWNDHSKKRNNYSKIECITCWNSLPVGYTINTLKYFAKTDYPSKYPMMETRKLDFIEYKGSLLENGVFSKHVNDWFNGETKTLGIRSFNNADKTSTIIELLDGCTHDFEFEKMLFVLARSNASEICKNYSKYLFKTDKSVDRVVCHFDQLHNLLPDCGEIKSYDLIIFEDIEYVLSCFELSTNKESTFNVLNAFANNARKILAIDSYFEVKSFDFVKNFGECTVLKNVIKGAKICFNFTNCEIMFEKGINSDIEKEHDIALICMSVDFAKKMYNKYKTRIRCIYVDDKILPERCQGKYQLIVYAPTTGFNFSLIHDYKVSVALFSKCISQSELCRTILENGKIIGKEVRVYLNNLPNPDKMCYYEYDDMEYFSMSLHKNIDPKIVKNSSGMYVVSKELNMYGKVLIHNEVDKSNRDSNRYVPYLVNILKDKDHECIFINEEYKDPMNMIMKARDISDNEFKTLLVKWNSDVITESNRNAMEKYMFKKSWNINDVDEEVLKKYYNETRTFMKLRYFINNHVGYEKDDKNKVCLGFDNSNREKRKEILTKFLRKLGFNNPGDEIGIENTVFQQAFINIINDDDLFNIYGNEYELNKSKIKPKSVFWVMNGILKNWGMRIRSKLIRGNITRGEKNTTESLSLYYLDYINDFGDFV